MALAHQSRRKGAGRQRHNEVASDVKVPRGERVGPESEIAEGAVGRGWSVQQSTSASSPLFALQRTTGNQAFRSLLYSTGQRIEKSAATPKERQDDVPDRARTISRASALPSAALFGLHRAVGNQAVQRLFDRSTAVGRKFEAGASEALQPKGDRAPKAGVITDLNTPAGGETEQPLADDWFVHRKRAAGLSRRVHAGSTLSQTDGPMHAPRPAPDVPGIARKIGDGHDLKSARLKGDPVLEAVFDNERVLRTGSRGPAVIKVQHALTDLGIRMTQHGIDGDFGAETRGQVKTFQKSASLTDDGVVGPKTIEALDNQLATGAGGPGPLPSPVPAPPAKVAPTLAAVINTGPTPGLNGQMNFVINWQLGSNAGIKGGFVIQDVLFVWRTRDAKGKDVPNPDPRTSPLRYFEAWRVAPKSKTLTPVTTDTFFWPGTAPWAGNSSKGRVTIAATARYFDEADTLPKHMVANNPATFAGILQSSLTDPALTTPSSGPVAHSLAFHWDSTKTPNSPTVLDANTP